MSQNIDYDVGTSYLTPIVPNYYRDAADRLPNYYREVADQLTVHQLSWAGSSPIQTPALVLVHAHAHIKCAFYYFVMVLNSCSISQRWRVTGDLQTHLSLLGGSICLLRM